MEDRIYAMWEAGEHFAPREDVQTKPFTIIMPPPNANDPLHIGHAMFVTIEDILIRYHRMRGDRTLWVPGADHAGIETQFVFEKKLKKQDKSRFDYDRETLYSLIWDYVAENAGVAKNQMKKIGASADWNRFTFTLDPDIVSIVLDTFTKLHNDDLLYREERLVNYCTHCGTGFSELEIKHEVRRDPLLYMKYGPFTIATVRPETKFRDTALAVNPKDKRYKDHIGKTYEIPGLLGPITMTVIADEEVDPEFGTGIMKVTPAHDFHDFELGKKHNLAVTPIITLQGRMDFSWFINDPAQPDYLKDRARAYHGMKVEPFRKKMIEDLKSEGLIDKIDDTYEHTVSTCYRCGRLLEPLPLPQFYVRVQPLVKPVLKALKDKKVKILGPGYDKILIHWLKSLKDWNISRQIVWGIRMPVWYKAEDNPNISVTFVAPDKALISGTVGQLLQTYSLEEITAGLQSLNAPIDADYIISVNTPGDGYIQETDTFDTWFSSAQWPFATLQTTKPGDFETYYPTQIMETAYDILIFWVMRMLMMGLYVTGDVPFSTVYLHGLVRDEKGQKMSKSKGNVINPIEVIEKYGADALRLALVISTTPGRDSNTGDSKIRGMRNFTNKLWNASRFILMNQNDANDEAQPLENDAAFYKQLNTIIRDVTRQLDHNKVGLAAETVYQQFWHWYCDVCIEDNKSGKLSYNALRDGLRTFLILLHPFTPFITEELWSYVNTSAADSHLIVTPWPHVVDASSGRA